jgi:hypothetical protein
MLAYFMTSPGSNHAITLPIEQPAQQRSQQQVFRGGALLNQAGARGASSKTFFLIFVSKRH